MPNASSPFATVGSQHLRAVVTASVLQRITITLAKSASLPPNQSKDISPPTSTAGAFRRTLGGAVGGGYTMRHSAGSLLLLLAAAAALYFLLPHPLLLGTSTPRIKRSPNLPLRFRYDGTFKILQVADMHFGNGLPTRCRDVSPSDAPLCSDLNTTRFLRRLIRAERPDLIAFTGDNIFGPSATDAAESLFRAFAPAIESGIPWAAVLGNHDQESTMNREEIMSLLSLMDYSVSRTNPAGFSIDGFGNYDLNVLGAFGSELANTSVLNLYFLDSGDQAVVNGGRTYGWIKESQLLWLRSTSQRLQGFFSAPALAFFHIPFPEIRELRDKEIVGHFQQAVSCSSVNSGVLKALVSMGDVKAVFIGHDHLNDFCGNISNIRLCYGGGFGYHGYGKASWLRRARVIGVELRTGHKVWTEVGKIRTWKRFDDEMLTKIDEQVLWRHDEEG